MVVGVFYPDAPTVITNVQVDDENRLQASALNSDSFGCGEVTRVESGGHRVQT